MKRQNFMFKFARVFTISCILPIYIILALLFILLLFFTKELYFFNTLIVIISLISVLIIAYLILLITGFILYKRFDFKQDELYFYQNKRKIKKTDIDKIYQSRFMKLYILQFKQKNKKINFIYYFYTFDELIYFVKRNHLLHYLPLRSINDIEAYVLLNTLEIDKENIKIVRYPCPCCDHLTYNEKPGGTYFICPVCYWEDDLIALNDPDYVCDVNKVSLNQARLNFIEFKACHKDMIPYVREPIDYEVNKE